MNSPASWLTMTVLGSLAPILGWGVLRADPVGQHIENAEREAVAAAQRYAERPRQFIHAQNTGAAAFAEEVLSLRGKWAYVTWNQASYQAWLAERYAHHMFGAERLRSEIANSVGAYQVELQAIENRLLVTLAADTETAGHSGESPITKDILQERIGAASRESQQRVAGALGADVGAVIGGEVAAVIATRMLLSAGILSAGAASGWATFGIGAVVSIVVDSAVGWITDPEGRITRDLINHNNRLADHLTDGGNGLRGLSTELVAMATARSTWWRATLPKILKGD